MDAQLNCATCGATFHQYNLRQKYCSATFALRVSTPIESMN